MANWLTRRLLLWTLPAIREPSDKVTRDVMVAIATRSIGGGMATRSQAQAAWRAGVDTWLQELRRGPIRRAEAPPARPAPEPWSGDPTRWDDDPAHPDDEEVENAQR